MDPDKVNGQLTIARPMVWQWSGPPTCASESVHQWFAILLRRVIRRGSSHANLHPGSTGSMLEDHIEIFQDYQPYTIDQKVLIKFCPSRIRGRGCWGTLPDLVDGISLLRVGRLFSESWAINQPLSKHTLPALSASNTPQTSDFETANPVPSQCTAFFLQSSR